MKQRIKGGWITIIETSVKCPNKDCDGVFKEQSFLKKLDKEIVAYVKCSKCKEKVGITQNIVGDFVSWLKSEEDDISKF